MDRADLERLDRAALIAKAEGLGVARANILTRPELVDELLVRSASKDDRDLPRARGFFGRARDLVAKVIEKGLHLPDAAERLRSVRVSATPTAARVAPAVVPTVTLAEIYAAQGHRPRAIEVLRRVLELEADHAAARDLLTKLEAAPLTAAPVAARPAEPADEDVPTPVTTPSGAPPPAAAQDAAGVTATEAVAAQPSVPAAPAAEVETPSRRAGATDPAPPLVVPASSLPQAVEARPAVRLLDDAPLPSHYDVDECVGIAVDPVTLYVYWEVRRASFDHVRRVRPGGTLTLRVLIITPAWDGPRSAVRDFDVDAPLSNRTVRDLPAGAVVRAAIGWRTGQAFLPIAHAPALETPPGAPCPIVADAFVRWTPRGLRPVTPHDRDYASIGHALERLAPVREVVVTEHAVAGHAASDAPLGPSEVSAGFGPTTERQPATAPSSGAML